MATLADARASEIACGLAALGNDIDHVELRPVETGLVMLQGRMGGEGVFAPRRDAKTEDDGWLVTYVYDAARQRLTINVIGPSGIARGRDGNLWVTTGPGDSVIRVTAQGAATKFPVSAGGNPTQITSGSDGNLWFTEPGTNHIGRLTPDGILTEFLLPTAGTNPHAITSGPDGNLWFTSPSVPKIGRITTQGTVSEFALPADLKDASSITAGPDGNVWFTAFPVNPPQPELMGRVNLQ